MTDQYVIWTRYERPKGSVVRHAYGPYASRAQAASALAKMKRNHLEHYGQDSLDRSETAICKIIGDTHD